MAPQLSVTMVASLGDAAVVAAPDVELRVIELIGQATPAANGESDQVDLMAAWLGRSAPLEAVPVPTLEAGQDARRRRFPRLFRGR